jgi:hypothetical protein
VTDLSVTALSFSFSLSTTYPFPPYCNDFSALLSHYHNLSSNFTCLLSSLILPHSSFTFLCMSFPLFLLSVIFNSFFAFYLILIFTTTKYTPLHLHPPFLSSSHLPHSPPSYQLFILLSTLSSLLTHQPIESFLWIR